MRSLKELLSLFLEDNDDEDEEEDDDDDEEGGAVSSQQNSTQLKSVNESSAQVTFQEPLHSKCTDISMVCYLDSVLEVCQITSANLVKLQINTSFLSRGQ